MKVYIYDKPVKDGGVLLGTEEAGSMKDVDTPEFRRLCYEKYDNKAKVCSAKDHTKKRR